MKTVYLVRYGESESNAGGLILGAEKTPLTEEGMRQARVVADRCKKLMIDAIIASPALRTKQTAEIIAEAIGVDITYEESVLEWDRGSERIGKPASDPALKEKEALQFDLLDDPSFRYKDAENFNDLNRRAARALAILEQQARKNLLVVGHGLFTRVLVGKAIFGGDFSGKDCRRLFSALKATNTGLTVLQYGGEHPHAPWELVTWNDHAHLG